VKLYRRRDVNETLSSTLGIVLRQVSRMESRGMEVADNRQKLLSVPEKCTTSERNVLNNGRKKTPVRSQGRRGRERLMERSWLQLVCCAPVSGREVVAYFGVREVAKTEVLNR